jgi:RNA-binding protein
MESYQRAHLRGLAHGLKPVVLVGASGVTPEILRAAQVALHDHELIKVRLQRPEDKQGFAEALATGTDSVLCGVVGHTVILYRRNSDKPRISVPQRRRTSVDA